MSDEKLRKLIFDKYNVTYNGIDCIEMPCLQPVINTIRQHDDAKTTRLIEGAINAMKDKHKSELKQKQLELLDEALDSIHIDTGISDSHVSLFKVNKIFNKLKQRIGDV